MYERVSCGYTDYLWVGLGLVYKKKIVFFSRCNLWNLHKNNLGIVAFRFLRFNLLFDNIAIGVFITLDLLRMSVQNKRKLALNDFIIEHFPAPKISNEIKTLRSLATYT